MTASYGILSRDQQGTEPSGSSGRLWTPHLEADHFGFHFGIPAWFGHLDSFGGSEGGAPYKNAVGLPGNRLNSYFQPDPGRDAQSAACGHVITHLSSDLSSCAYGAIKVDGRDGIRSFQIH